MFVIEVIRKPHYIFRLLSRGISNQLTEMNVVAPFKLILDGNLALPSAPNFFCKNIEPILSYLGFLLYQLKLQLQRVAQQLQIFPARPARL